MKLVGSILDNIMAERPVPTAAMPQGIRLDKGYDFDEVRDIIRELGFTAHIRARGEEAKAIKQGAGFKARRWVVEHTHSWMNRFRRILVRRETLPETFIAMLHLACGIITWRATGLLEQGLSKLFTDKFKDRLLAGLTAVYERQAGFPVLDEYPSRIPAPMALVFEERFWVCVDSTLLGAPMLAWVRFQNADRNALSTRHLYRAPVPFRRQKNPRSRAGAGGQGTGATTAAALKIGGGGTVANSPVRACSLTARAAGCVRRRSAEIRKNRSRMSAVSPSLTTS